MAGTSRDTVDGRRWALFTVVLLGAVAVGVVAGTGGLLFGGDFASGGRAPVRSALLWSASGAAAALPVALLPWLGFRVRGAVTFPAAAALAAALAAGGWLYSDGWL